MKRTSSTLIFSKKDVTDLLTMEDCIASMEKTFLMLASDKQKQTKHFTFPVRHVLGLPLPDGKPGFLGQMPAFVSLPSSRGEQFKGYFATKDISVFPWNHKGGIPSHQGVVLLFEAETGRLVAILDASEITAIRTAAVSGLAIKHLRKQIQKTFKTVAILGSGTQARTHVDAVFSVLRGEVEEVRVWSRDFLHAKQCAEDISSSVGATNASIKAFETAKEAVNGADVVCTVTSSTEPVISYEWLKPGCVICAVGACTPKAREIDTATMKNSILVVDKIESALSEAGDILIPLNVEKQLDVLSLNLIELSDVVSGNIQRSSFENKIVAFKALGLAVEDLMTAIHIYEKAVAQKSSGDLHLNCIDFMESGIKRKPTTIGFPTLQDIHLARDVLKKHRVMRTPLVPFFFNQTSASSSEEIDQEVFLKLENIQPYGSYKIRGATNALSVRLSNPATKDVIEKVGVFTASAGNYAQGLAFALKKQNMTCKLTLVVPNNAAETKLASVKRIYHNVQVIKVTSEKWFQVMLSGKFDPSLASPEGTTTSTTGEEERSSVPIFFSPTADPLVMAGNGTIALEILEDLDKVDAVIIPYGGGGCTIGMATALKALSPTTRIFACEVETAAPLAASLQAQKPLFIETAPSFVDGIGGPTVLPELFETVKELVHGSLTVSETEVKNAVRLLAERNRIIAEGAGACALAAFLKFRTREELQHCRTIVCLVSGGNIDNEKFVHVVDKAQK